mmetsp:Transcript_33914/g.99955  ORF Transcript_33914/g.99955 Transcript_33914/m.99955 type:complete len:80 (-) Transcript_33914:1789-2028(-)
MLRNAQVGYMNVLLYTQLLTGMWVECILLTGQQQSSICTTKQRMLIRDKGKECRVESTATHQLIVIQPRRLVKSGGELI